MEYGAIDLHKRRSQIRIIGEDGGVVLERRVGTSRAEFDRVFVGRPALRVVMESSTESEWVAQHLETRGHEVIVVDPNYAPTYGARTRKVKTDRRDAAAFAAASGGRGGAGTRAWGGAAGGAGGCCGGSGRGRRRGGAGGWWGGGGGSRPDSVRRGGGPRTGWRAKR